MKKGIITIIIISLIVGFSFYMSHVNIRKSREIDTNGSRGSS